MEGSWNPKNFLDNEFLISFPHDDSSHDEFSVMNVLAMNFLDTKVITGLGDGWLLETVCSLKLR